MSLERLIIGIGAGILAVVLTFLMPVSPRRLNQQLINILVLVSCFASTLALLDFPLSLIAGAAASLVAILYRDVMRFVRHVVYDVTKYRRRDFWYRRIGEAIVGGRGTRSRRR
jgi:hypothetical protein